MDTRLEWRSALKKAVMDAVLREQRTVLLVGDVIALPKPVVADLCLLLDACQLPMDLFSADERVELIAKLHELSIEWMSAMPVEQHLCSLLRDRLHVVITMRSSTQLSASSQLTELCRRPVRICFPAWDATDRRILAEHFMDLTSFVSKEHEAQLVDLALFICESAISLSLAAERGASTLVELLRLFRQSGERRFEQLVRTRNRYETGVEKLDFAAKQMSEMQLELRRLRPELLQTSAETDALMTAVEFETVQVENARQVVKAEEAAANGATVDAQAMKTECERQLSDAIPALESAVRALHHLKQSDISYLKTMCRPPDAIKTVMEAVCILLGEAPARVADPSSARGYSTDYWPTAQRVLSDLHFLNRLKSFARDSVSESVMTLIRGERYVGSAHFTAEAVRQASLAAESICLWVRAVEVYDRVSKVVRPKRQRVRQAEARVRSLLADLDVKRRALQQVSDRLQKLNDRFGQMTQKKQDLEQQIRSCELKMQRAEQLVAGLGGEERRWETRTKELSADCDRFAAHILLSSAIAVFLGCEAQHIRRDFLSTWRSRALQLGLLVGPEPFLVEDTLADAEMTRRWRTNGLPDDRHSLENAAIVMFSRQWPLLYDPLKEATQWLVSTEGDRLVGKIKQSDTSINGVLADAISSGRSLIVTDISEPVSPLLTSLLDGDVLSDGTRKFIRLGSNMVDYNESFRLFLIARDAAVMRSGSLKACPVDFSMTRANVENRLLDVFVWLVEPRLQRRKEELTRSNAASRDELRRLERQILDILEMAEGNILEDERAVDTLSQTKTLSQQVLRKEEESFVAKQETERLREAYRSHAQHGCQLWNALQSVADLRRNYFFSFHWYLVHFRQTVEKHVAKFDDESQSESELQMETATELFAVVAPSLLAHDRLAFAFAIARRLRPSLATLPTNSDVLGDDVRGVCDDCFNGALVLATDEAHVEQLVDGAAPLLLLFDGANGAAEAMATVWRLAERAVCASDRIFVRSAVDVDDGLVAAAKMNGHWLVVTCDSTPTDQQTELFLRAKDVEDESTNEKYRVWLMAHVDVCLSSDLLLNYNRVAVEEWRSMDAEVKELEAVARKQLKAKRGESGVSEAARGTRVMAVFHALVRQRMRYGPIGWSRQLHISLADFRCALSLLPAVSRLRGVAHATKQTDDAITLEKLRDTIVKPIYKGKVWDEHERRLMDALFDGAYRNAADMDCASADTALCCLHPNAAQIITDKFNSNLRTSIIALYNDASIRIQEGAIEAKIAVPKPILISVDGEMRVSATDTLHFKQVLLKRSIEFAQRRGITLPYVHYGYRVMRRSEAKVPQGVIVIEGIYILGAIFDQEKHSLMELPKGQIGCRLPPVICELRTEPNEDGGAYRCHVYSSVSIRGSSIDQPEMDVVLTVALPSSESTQHWTLRGVLGACSLC